MTVWNVVYLFQWATCSHCLGDEVATHYGVDQLSQLLYSPHPLGGIQGVQLGTGRQGGSQPTDTLLPGSATELEVKETRYEIN